jgi:hypothetical protein
MTRISPSPSRRQTALFFVWMAGLCTTWWLLSQTATGDLSTPPVASWREFTRWADRRDEAELTIVVVRIVAQGLLGYLLVLSIVGSILRLAPGANTTLVDRFTPAWLVRLLDTSLGLGLAAALGLATVTLSTDSQPFAPPAGEIIAVSPDPSVTVGAEEPLVAMPIDSDQMVMRPIDRLEAEPAAPAQTSPAVETLLAPTSLEDVTNRGDRIWLTEPGDHLWRIAAETLADETGAEPSTPEIDRYWRELVAHNRGRLLDAANPDFIVPGQEFELPPVR